MGSETTRISSRGQVVIPRSIRERLDLKQGELWSVHGDQDMIILRRVKLPDPHEVERMLEWGKRFAEEKQISREDVDPAIRDIRSKSKKDRS